MNKMDERILVVPRVALFGPNGEDGFEGAHGPTRLPRRPEHYLAMVAEHGYLARRGDVETDPTLKQPIPYALLTRPSDDAGDGLEVFTYERLTGGGEKRLHGKLSIGVGGHVNRHGIAVSALLRDEVLREIDEEVAIDGPTPSPELVGLLNDESNAVGQVHVGFVYRLTFARTVDVQVRETDQLEGDWRPLVDLLAADVRTRMENWSALALELLVDTEARNDAAVMAAYRQATARYSDTFRRLAENDRQTGGDDG